MRVRVPSRPLCLNRIMVVRHFRNVKIGVRFSTEAPCYKGYVVGSGVVVCVTDQTTTFCSSGTMYRAATKSDGRKITMCPIDPLTCTCQGHTWPGVMHFMPCCDEPHITEEEYAAQLEGNYTWPE